MASSIITTDDVSANVAARLDTLVEIRDSMRRFAAERDWDQFHSPRNLLLAMSGEVGELCELFQWRGEGAADISCCVVNE